jgi:hypothetical protein
MTDEAAAPPPVERLGNTEPSPGAPTPPGAAEPHYEGSTQWVDGKPIGLSYSQLSTYGQCPKKFELKYRDPDAKAKERGLGSGTAGSSVHDTIEHSEYQGWFTLDREEALDLLEAEFTGHFERRLTAEMERVNGDESRIYWGGRKSKDWPEGETADWWRVNQRVFFRRYLQIRQRDLEAGVKLVRDEEGNLPWIERRVSTLLDVGEPEPILITGMVDVTMMVALTGEPILRDWKGLPLETPLPTPTGWTTMGAVQVGDQLLGRNGHPCTVTAKSGIHENPCRRIWFADGSTIVADVDHRWVTLTGTPARGEQVLTTAEIENTLFERGQLQHRVVNAEPLELPEVTLPVDPYVFGVWLGDGQHDRGVVTKPDDGLWATLEARGCKVGPLGSNGGRTIHGLAKLLRAAGLLGIKHVPDTYRRASLAQRLDLLRGLMDTDGTWNGTRNRAVFETTDKAMADAVAELVASLGERAYRYHGEHRGFGLTITRYRVDWAPTRFIPFLASTKADRATLSRSVKSRRRLITRVARTITVPTQCVTVDSPDETYLAGEQMLVTHNTGRSQPDPFQLAVYSWLMREAGAVTASLGEMAWLRGASMETMLKQHELDATVALIPDAFRNLYHGIASGFFPWIHNDMCPWCTVRDGCPYGRTLP